MPDRTRGPLTHLTMAVLLALAEGDRHGYALMQAIEDQSEGWIKPGTGSLYAALDRLMSDGLIEEARSEIHQGRARKFYGLTKTGREVATSEAKRMLQVVETARARRLLDGEDLADAMGSAGG